MTARKAERIGKKAMRKIRVALAGMLCLSMVAHADPIDLRGADLSGRDLIGATFEDADVTGANFSGSWIAGAFFYDTIGFSAAQLYSTASYQQYDLVGLVLGQDGGGVGPALDLSGWNFSGQDLSVAVFWNVDLVGADFSGANLSGVVFYGDISGAAFDSPWLSADAWPAVNLPEPCSLGIVTLGLAWAIKGRKSREI